MLKAALDKIIVQPIDGSEDTGGFVVQEDTMAPIRKATVISVGPGPRNMNGALGATGFTGQYPCREGDVILYPAKFGLKYSDEDGDFLILTENEILAVVK